MLINNIIENFFKENMLIVKKERFICKIDGPAP
jgi:hypothetical protein